METIGHLLHAWVMFVSPLIFLGYKLTLKSKIVFTAVYGTGIIFFRKIYEFASVPFGTHMILLVILQTILLYIILEEISWLKAIFISLSTFIIILINDAIIFVSVIKYFNITISEIGKVNVMQYIFLWITSNLSLIVLYIAGIIRNHKKKSYIM